MEKNKDCIDLDNVKISKRSFIYYFISMVVCIPSILFFYAEAFKTKFNLENYVSNNKVCLPEYISYSQPFLKSSYPVNSVFEKKYYSSHKLFV